MNTNIQSLDQFAYANELQVVNTEDGKALIGFESWEQAEQIADQLGQDIIHISRRDGHHQWTHKGWMSEPFDMINDVHWADDYSIYTSAEQVAELIAELEEYDEDEERIEELKQLHAELESMPEDDIAIVLDNRVTEYCHCKQMSYHYDVYRHEIAVKAWSRDTIILFAIGDFYVAYGDDAVELSNMFGIILTKRDEVNQAGFPKHQIDSFLPRLVRAGRRVAIS